MASLKNNKLTGPDFEAVETIKASRQLMIEHLYGIFNQSWATGCVPSKWNKSSICPIFKQKGDPMDCRKYRGISLMSHRGKIYERILERRLRVTVEENLSEAQCGF